jgi:hypothetical protein
MNTAGPIFRQSLRVICVANTMQLEDLINLVRERPALYDPSDSKHRDRDVISALWEEVAAELNCTGKNFV